MVKVDEITFEVDELKARVALHAAVGDLVALDVGADVSIGRVKLEIKGVEAQALLKVRLNNVYAILARTLTTIDRNPKLLEAVLKPLGETVGAVGKTVEKTVPPLTDSLRPTPEQRSWFTFAILESPCPIARILRSTTPTTTQPTSPSTRASRWSSACVNQE